MSEPNRRPIHGFLLVILKQTFLYIKNTHTLLFTKYFMCYIHAKSAWSSLDMWDCGTSSRTLSRLQTLFPNNCFKNQACTVLLPFIICQSMIFAISEDLISAKGKTILKFYYGVKISWHALKIIKYILNLNDVNYGINRQRAPQLAVRNNSIILRVWALYTPFIDLAAQVSVFFRRHKNSLIIRGRPEMSFLLWTGKVRVSQLMTKYVCACFFLDRSIWKVDPFKILITSFLDVLVRVACPTSIVLKNLCQFSIVIKT